MEIDLGKYRSQNVYVLSGRDRGISIRTELALDLIDSKPDSVIVKIPTDIFSINSSFFLGLFAKSVRSLGEIAFRNKYSFIANAAIMSNINRGIKEALKDSLPIPVSH